MDHYRVLVCLALCALWHIGPNVGQSQVEVNIVARLETLERQVSRQQNQLEAQNKHIADLQTKVTNQESAIAEQQATINKQQTTIAEQQKTISEQQNEISKQRSSLSEHQLRLTWLEDILASKTNPGNWTVTKTSVEEDLADQPEIRGVVHHLHQEDDNANSYRAKLHNHDNTAQYLNKRFVLESSGPVAFHAINVRRSDAHVGIDQKIMFPKVMLNLGSGYHSQHGIFITPAAGLYIFSTSLMAYNHPSPIDASLMKNGTVLARVSANADIGVNDQGSVTVVTQLAVGDEVWVDVYATADTKYWGDSFTSFSGVLLWPL